MVECFKNLLQILWVNVKQIWYNHILWRRTFQFKFQIKGQVHFIGELVRKEWKLAWGVFKNLFLHNLWANVIQTWFPKKNPPKNNPEIQTNMHWLMTDAIHTQYKTLIWQNTFYCYSKQIPHMTAWTKLIPTITQYVLSLHTYTTTSKTESIKLLDLNSYMYNYKINNYSINLSAVRHEILFLKGHL